MIRRAMTCSLCATALATVTLHAVAADEAKPPSNPAAAQELPQVVVIGSAPLPGVGLPLAEVPDNVQTLGADDLRRQHLLDIPDALNSNFAGVSVGEGQNNPFQADVNYHGFTASPVLGTPQGLSVYVDGVRVNEAFGDIVNWDLIPEAAIANVSLAGANPVYGLNTLGGAITVQTKSGHDFPGTELQAYGGSFGRHAFEGATGGSAGGLDYFVVANFFKEDGWRDMSPSTVKQVFGKLGYEDERTDIDLSYTYADNSLAGNGTTPQSMLDYRYQSIYTAPDLTGNRLHFVNLLASRFLTKNLVLSGNVYYRDLTTVTNNGDVNDNNYQSADYNGPAVDCSHFTSLSDVAFCANGINRTSTTTQHTVGVGLQATDTDKLLGLKNHAAVGASYEHATVGYTQSFQYAELTPARIAAPIIDPNNPREVVNSVSGSSKTLGVYFTDTLSPSGQLHITVAGRYNRVVENLGGFSRDTDLGDFCSGGGESGPCFNDILPLSGDHSFTHFNPYVGFTVTPNKALTLFANFNEGSRAPTIIELGCSDPTTPCGLPNNFASDPDLKQVVSHTFEVGARGSLADDVLTWSLDLFHTASSNDIQFVATTTSQGYFANVGDTRRQGLDLTLGGKVNDSFRWHLVYSLVDATYQSSFLVSAGSNSTADNSGNIQVSPGNHIPLIPRNLGRLRLDYTPAKRLDVGATLIGASGVYLHGDENNANVPNGVDFIGSGHIPGYVIVNLDSTWHVTRRADLFVRIVNALNRRYATAGFLTSDAFNPDGSFRVDPATWTNDNSVSPGAPIGVWAGVRVHWQD
jgi:outer membrane receptor protein involved in Fe transport